MEDEEKSHGALGRIFNFAPDLRACISDNDFCDEFERFLNQVTQYLKFHSYTLRVQGRPVKELIYLLHPAYAGLFNKKVWTIKDKALRERGRAEARDVIYALARLLPILLCPEKPKGLLSNTRNKACPATVKAGELEQAHRLILVNKRRMQKIDIAFQDVMELFEHAEAYTRALAVRLRSLKDLWRTRPTIERESFKTLSLVLGVSIAKDAINALITDLVEAGFDLRPNADGWWERVRPRPKRRSKKNENLGGYEKAAFRVKKEVLKSPHGKPAKA